MNYLKLSILGGEFMIVLKNVVKTYDGTTNVVDNLDLVINDGEFIVLIGESGCGKTTTMKMINKLIGLTSGHIFIDGKDILSMNSIELRRQIGYVIQKVGLFPHMTVGQNIEVVPRLKGWEPNKRKERSEELLKMVNLDPDEYYHRYPNELSGGQQQRVGVARALAVNPSVILMDEPFSALDPITREQLQNELLRLQDELHKTIIFVTHDMDEALKLGDKIAVMKDGKVLQYDTPENILKNPNHEYVEYFVGRDRLWKSPEMVYAKDIMRKQVIKIGLQRTPAQAIELMKEKNVTTLAIVSQSSDQPQSILGYVTKSELRFAKSHDVKMKDLMKTDHETINENLNMVNVLNTMTQKELNHVFVVDDHNTLVGIISQSSLIRIISDMASDFEEEKH